MKRQIITTADGSKTIYIPEWNEHYHSKHGAIQEALHVFIKTGFYSGQASEVLQNKEISILEIGFGTGLNAFLTALEAVKAGIKVNYTGVEAFPVKKEEWQAVNYATIEEEKLLFNKLHEAKWEYFQPISDVFSLRKQQKDFREINDNGVYNLIYFDAFGARVQPELWTEFIFKQMYKALKPKGVLVTYSAKGSVRRAMQAVGFTVERLPGPPGKREMLRATKG